MLRTAFADSPLIASQRRSMIFPSWRIPHSFDPFNKALSIFAQWDPSPTCMERRKTSVCAWRLQVLRTCVRQCRRSTIRSCPPNTAPRDIPVFPDAVAGDQWPHAFFIPAVLWFVDLPKAALIPKHRTYCRFLRKTPALRLFY